MPLTTTHTFIMAWGVLCTAMADQYKNCVEKYDIRFDRQVAPGQSHETNCRDICTKGFEHYEKVCLNDPEVMKNCSAFVNCLNVKQESSPEPTSLEFEELETTVRTPTTPDSGTPFIMIGIFGALVLIIGILLMITYLVRKRPAVHHNNHDVELNRVGDNENEPLNAQGLGDEPPTIATTAEDETKSKLATCNLQ